MSDPQWGSLLIAIAGFLALGHLINYASQTIYWWWIDFRARKEDEKMLQDQEENVPDNVVKLDEVRKNVTYYIDYGDDTVH